MFNFFQKKSIGLDIADHSIEVVELIKIGRKIKILSLNRLKLEPGIVEKGRIKNQEKLTKAIKEVFSKAQPYRITAKKLIFSLPESQIYTHVFDIIFKGRKVTPNFVVTERKNLVWQEARKNIPLDQKDLLFSDKILKVTILDQQRIRMENLLIAASRTVALEWREFFQAMKIEVNFFEIETLAILRGLFIKPPKEPVCVIDMGAVTTNVAIFDRGDLRYSYSIKIAGDVLNRKIVETLKVKPEQAEELKNKYGLNGKNPDLTSVLKNTLKPVLKEIKESFDHFENKTGLKINEIILVGGSAQLKGLVDYFVQEIGLPVKIGQPTIFINEKKAVNSLFYIEAIGLALRGLIKKWDKSHPVIKIKKFKQIEIKEQENLETVDAEEATISSSEQSLTQGSAEEKSISRLIDVPVALAKGKIRSKKILLIIVLILGLTTLALVYQYRSYQKDQKKQALETIITQYGKTQSFDLKVPVAVKPEEYTDDRAKGRIIENVITWAGDYNEALANSKINIEKELQEGEVFWVKPISPKPESVVFPLTIKWLIYSNEEANQLLLRAVDKLNKKQLNYALNNIVKIDLEPSDNQSIYFLTGRITISLDQLIELEQDSLKEIEESLNSLEVEEKLTLIKINISDLNVRAGSGANYDVIGQVYLEESYPLLQEQNKWFKIRMNNNLEGWIFSDYAVKQ
ncbi:pilus assembly protein PilM [Patescibacteria group bacterium]|nr:pilus assembly protein PilM [Patescibacteria group bacterium]